MGFDIERFVGEVNEGLLCSICRDVLEEPLQAPCEHTYCSSCVYAWLTHYNTCPEDRQNLWPSDLKPIFRYMKNDLDRLQIRCDNQLNGCTAVVRLGNLDYHLKEECDFITVSCPNTGCVESLHRGDLETHLIICDFQTAKCTKGCGLQVNMNEISKHSCVAELRKAMERQKTDFELELRDLKRDMETRLDSHRTHMVYKETTLQNQIDDLKTEMTELLRETKSLKARESQRVEALNSEDHEQKEIIDWLKELKYQDEIAEKYCGACNKRFLYVRKEPLTSFGEQISTSPTSEDAFLTTLRTARQKPTSPCPSYSADDNPGLSNLPRSNSEVCCLNRATLESWRRNSEVGTFSSNLNEGSTSGSRTLSS